MAYIKANPGKVNYGSAGVGSSQHLAASMLIAATGINIVHVPYKGTSPAETDLIAGHIAMMLDTTACLPFIAGGRMKALAVASKARNPALPNVPTFDEIGIPGVHSSAWYGIMAPAGVPQEVVNRINAEVNALLKTAEVRKRIADFGGEPGGGTPAEFERFVASELRRYADVVKASGARVE
jgi:tripartite-type tricarboxylate transporter receptor subunit TctC